MKKEYEVNTAEHKPYGFGNFLPVEKDPDYKEPKDVKKEEEGEDDSKMKFEEKCHKIKESEKLEKIKEEMKE